MLTSCAAHFGFFYFLSFFFSTSVRLLIDDFHTEVMQIADSCGTYVCQGLKIRLNMCTCEVLISETSVVL